MSKKFTTEKLEKAEKTVGIICKSAMVNILVIGEVEEGLTPNLEKMAEAVKNHFSLDESVMENYRKKIEEISEETSVPQISNDEAEETREIVYEMCDAADSVEEAMLYVRTVADMMFLWNPVLINE